MACWCWALPSPRLEVRSKIIILQHPFEERRPLRTAPIIEHGLSPGKCAIFRGKRFHSGRFSELDDELVAANCVLLYPSPEATDIRDLPPVGSGPSPTPPYTIIILDGTWRQARSIYSGSPPLHTLRKVCISGGRCSNYVVRTQPNDSCLSTVEAAAMCLQHVEQQPQLMAKLLAPLHALCHVQLNHGAAPHDSRPTQLQRSSEYVKVRAGGSKTRLVSDSIEEQDPNSLPARPQGGATSERIHCRDSVDESMDSMYIDTAVSFFHGSALCFASGVNSSGRVAHKHLRKPISGVVL